MIYISELHKKFGKVKVLEDLHLDIETGGIFAILGPNGSGKTTLIKAILGMVIPNKGKIEADGKNVIGAHRYRMDINYLPQIAQFPNNLKVAELIKMIKHLRGVPANDQKLIEYFQLDEYLNQKLGNLSGGTKQKVNLVLTLMFDSKLIILDEPTTGLDPISLLRLKDLIGEEQKKGKTILITSHIMSFVEDISDNIVFLLNGKIYFKGSTSQLKKETNQANLEHAIVKLLETEYA